MARAFLLLGSVLGFLAVALGAFAAHFLKEKLTPDLFAVFEVGVRYHMYHALALFIVAWALVQFPQEEFALAGWLFTGGILVFSGSLYSMSFTGARWLGAITPFGGIMFLAGWGWLAWKFWRLA